MTVFDAPSAFRARLDAFLATNPTGWTGVRHVRPNTDLQTPADGSPFVVIQFAPSIEHPVSIGAPGANRWREETSARFVLQVPLGAGEDEWRAAIGLARAWFRGKSFDGVTTFGASSPAFDDGNDDGLYWAFAWTVAYRYDLIG